MEQEYQDHRNVASPILVNNAPSVEDVQFRHIPIKIIQDFIVPQLDDKTLLNFALTNKKSLTLAQKELKKREPEHAKRILPDKPKKWARSDLTGFFTDGIGFFSLDIADY